MRIITLILVLLLAVVQYPMWFGGSGWAEVSELEQKVATVREHNERSEARNARLASEVAALGEGKEAVEEKARLELGMLGAGEIYIQVLPKNQAAAENMTERPVIPEKKTQDH